MSKTFLSFRLKHVIRSCAFVIVALLVMKGETSRAAAPHFTRHLVDTTICSASSYVLDITHFLTYTDGDAGTDTITVLNGPVLVPPTTGSPGNLSTTFPVIVNAAGTVPSTSVGYAIAGGGLGVRTFALRISDGTAYDTITFVVRWVQNPTPVITGHYDQVHVGSQITFTGNVISNSGLDTTFYGHVVATWGTTGSNISVAGGVVTGINIGNDNVTYTFNNNVCPSTTTSSPVTIRTNIPPVISVGATSISLIPGTTYTIPGTGFSSANNYIVYFGSVRAAVTSVTATAINVTVPVGAVYAPINVLDSLSQLSTFIMPSFTPKYDNAAFINATHTDVYGAPVQFDLPATVPFGGPYSAEYADLDGDGKSDMIISGTKINRIIVFRNTSTYGQINTTSFDVAQTFEVAYGPISLKTADFDGDGKLDIASACAGAAQVSVLRNTSTLGAISFATRFDLLMPGVLPSEIAIGDYNKDGRPDIAAVMLGVRSPGEADPGYVITEDGKKGRLAVATNMFNRSATVPLSLNSFQVTTVYTFDTFSAPISVAVGDLDGDNKADLVVSNHHKRQLEIFKNTSPTGGAPSFSMLAPTSTAVGNGTLAAGPGNYDLATRLSGYPEQVRIGDLDNDGKPDLAVAVSDSDLLQSNQYNKVVLFHNNGSGTFGTQDTSLNTHGASPVALNLTDLSGDGKLDIVNSNAGGGSISIFKNAGSFGFDSAVTKTMPSIGGVPPGPVGIVIGDIDGNTVHDIAVVSRGTNKLYVYRGYPRPDTSSIIGDTVMCLTSPLSTQVLHTHHGGGTVSTIWSVTNHGHITLSAAGDTSVTVTANTAGIDTVYYNVISLGDTNKVMKIIRVNGTGAPIPNVIVGNDTICIGQVTTLSLSSGTGGGTWTIVPASVASINSSTGAVTGLTAGDAYITYTVTTSCGLRSDYDTVVVRGPLTAPTPTGPSRVCIGLTISLTAAAPANGTFRWRSSDPSISTVSNTGTVGGVAAGQDTIFYVVSNVCGSDSSFIKDTVLGSPTVNPITGPAGAGLDSICFGQTIQFNDVTIGGTWSSADLSIATVTATGIVGGTAAGNTTITYTYANGCGTPATATRPIKVKGLPNPGTISGTSTLCSGASTVLSSNGLTGGVWRSTNTAVAAVDATGTVTGTAPRVAGANPRNTVIIRYIVTDACGSDSSVINFVINTRPRVTAITTTSGPAGLDSICVGSPLTETATPNSNVFPGAGLTTTWSLFNANATMTTASGATPNTIQGAVPGLDTVRFIVSNTCGADTAVLRRIKIVGSTDSGTIIAPDRICAGVPDFQLYDTAANGDTLTGGVWAVTTGAISISSTGIATIPTTIFGTNIITYTTFGFCNNTTTQHTIDVYPPSDAGTVSGPGTVCVGDTITLTDDLSIGDYWYSTNPAIATVDSVTGMVIGIGAGTVRIIYADTGFCSPDTAGHTVVVGGLAVTGQIFGQDTACVGGTAQLFDTVAAAAGGTWSVSGGIATISATGLVTAVGPNGGAVTISYTTPPSGCGTNSATLNFRVFAAPNFSSLTSRTACDSELFTYVPTSDSVGVVYNWTRASVTGIENASAAGTGTVNEYLNDTTNAVVNTTYIFTTSLHGCPATNNVTVAVSPTPHLTSQLFDTVCSGAQYVYVPTTTTAAGSTVLAWSRPVATGISNAANTGTGSISETLNNNTFPPTGATAIYIYTLNYTGCATHTENLTVSVNPSPGMPHITTHSPSAVCTNTMYQNFGSDSVAPAGVVYTWTATGAQVWATGSTKQYALVNFTETGNATVYLQATIPGLACPAKDSFPVTVGASVADMPEVIYFNGDFVCLANDRETYQWGYDSRSTLDSELFTGQTNQNYTVATPDFTGKHYFVITTHSGCMQKSYFNAPTVVTNVTASMGEMNVFPNPAGEFVNVEINNTPGGKYNVEVVNLLGQKLNAKELVNNKATLNVSDLANGVYFINCYRDGVKFASSKFVKN